MTELWIHELLQTAYEKGEVSPFDLAAELWGRGDKALAKAKGSAEWLVSFRLVKYGDEGRTVLLPTNAGRYWVLHGGYLAFLKEEPSGRATASRRVRRPRRCGPRTWRCG